MAETALFEVPSTPLASPTPTLPFDQDGKTRVNNLMPFLGGISRTTLTRGLRNYCAPNSVFQITGLDDTWWITKEEAEAAIEVFNARAKNAITYGKNPIRGRSVIWGKDMGKRAVEKGWPVPEKSKSKPRSKPDSEPSKETLVQRVEMLEKSLKQLRESLGL